MKFSRSPEFRSLGPAVAFSQVLWQRIRSRWFWRGFHLGSTVLLRGFSSADIAEEWQRIHDLERHVAALRRDRRKYEESGDSSFSPSMRDNRCYRTRERVDVARQYGERMSIRMRRTHTERWSSSTTSTTTTPNRRTRERKASLSKPSADQTRSGLPF